MTMRAHSRARETRSLPEGYQFGDAANGARVILLEADEFIVGTLPNGTTVHRMPALNCDHGPVIPLRGFAVKSAL